MVVSDLMIEYFAKIFNVKFTAGLENQLDKIGAGEQAETPAFTSTKNYSKEKVIESVKEARTIVYSIGGTHHAVVPTYATAKDVAMDFLRFMATDIALDAYSKATVGALLPFNFKMSDETYKSITDAQQGRYDYFQSKNGLNTLILPQYFPLVRYAYLSAFTNEKYYQTFSVTGNTITPADFMKNTKDAWDESKFADALKSAGLN